MICIRNIHMKVTIPMLFCQMKDLHNLSSEKGQEESSEGKFIQQKGRFQVTSADVAPKQNDMQKEQLIKLIRCLEQPSGLQAQAPDVGTSDWSQVSLAPSREKELQAYAAHLQQSITELSEDLQRLKMETAQLERKINALKNKGN